MGTRILRLVAAAALVTTALAPILATPAESATATFRVGTESTDVDGVIVVIFEDEVSDIDTTLAGISHEVVLTTERIPHATIYMEYDSQTSDALERFRARDDVKTAYREQQAVAVSDGDFTPNDPKYEEQWGPKAVHLPGAWDRTMASSDESIAVIDTGVWGTDDLDVCYTWPAAYVAGGSGEHGTGVAGVAAATTDNGEGIAGTSEACVRDYAAHNDNYKSTLASPTTSFIGAAILSAVGDDVDVIQISLASAQDTPLMALAAEEADEANVPTIVAAGNGEFGCTSYPAGYGSTFTVGGLTEDMNTQYCDGAIAAPSNSVKTITSDGYGDTYGTSFAAPFVSGTVALMTSVTSGDITDEEAYSHLYDSADPLPDTYETHLNASCAVAMAAGDSC